MEDKSSKNVLDFYLSTNKNKYDLVKTNKNGRPLSKAELTVLSCMEVLAREQEFSKMPYKKSYDYNKIIRILLAQSMGDSVNLLKKKYEYKKLIEKYDEFYLDEGYRANVIYKGMIDNFDLYQKPVYVEEKFVYANITLQETIRQGHIYWGAKGDRLESILEHIYGCCMLAIGIDSEYGYSINLNRLIKMLLAHEMGEIVIGDLTEWDIDKKSKEIIERQAVEDLLKIFSNSDELMKLYDEFNSKGTLTSVFANLIDKLEYDMQVKVYDNMGKYDFYNYPKNVVTESDSVQSIINNGAQNVFDVHYEYDKNRYSKIPCMRRILEETKKYKNNIE